jgi:predicted nucleic acid-binding protein
VSPKCDAVVIGGRTEDYLRMTRFVIDPPTCLALIQHRTPLSAGHQLVAPAVLRSDILTLLYSEVRAGHLSAIEGRHELDQFAEMKIRLLGDRVSRATAWAIARDLDWPDPRPAEYLAVAQLQADVLVTHDTQLVNGAAGITPIAGWDALTRLAARL